MLWVTMMINETDSEIKRNEVVHLNTFEPGWYGYLLDRPSEKLLIADCLDQLKEFMLKNDVYLLDFVEIVRKKDTVGIKWKVGKNDD